MRGLTWPDKLTRWLSSTAWVMRSSASNVWESGRLRKSRLAEGRRSRPAGETRGMSIETRGTRARFLELAYSGTSVECLCDARVFVMVICRQKPAQLSLGRRQFATRPAISGPDDLT